MAPRILQPEDLGKWAAVKVPKNALARPASAIAENEVGESAATAGALDNETPPTKRVKVHPGVAAADPPLTPPKSVAAGRQAAFDIFKVAPIEPTVPITPVSPEDGAVQNELSESDENGNPNINNKQHGAAKDVVDVGLGVDLRDKFGNLVSSLPKASVGVGLTATQPQQSDTLTAAAVNQSSSASANAHEELQDKKFKLLYVLDGYKSKTLKEYVRDARYNVRDIAEELAECMRKQSRLVAECMRKQSHLEYEESQAGIEFSKREVYMKTAEAELRATFEAAGISWELQKAYEAFCKSLYPKGGQESVGAEHTLFPVNHCYVTYDPTFGIFSDTVGKEGGHDLAKSNWRCETSIEGHGGNQVWAVYFFKVEAPGHELGSGATWGMHYPELYRRANQASRAGSKAAKDMLVALPDEKAMAGGGWLFDYKWEEALKDHPWIARRWRFRSAHNISEPKSVEQKEASLRLSLLHNATSE